MRSLLVGVMALSACSFSMKSVDPQWDGTSQPDCSDNVAPVVADGLGAGLLLGMGVIAGDKSVEAQNMGTTDSGADALAIVGFAGGLVLAISAAIGEHRYKECDRAMETWRLGAAIGNNRGGGDQATREAREFERQHPELAAHNEEVPPQPATPPRGFFCAASGLQPSASFCTRDKADCRRARDLIIDAVSDISECALQETAWCASGKCAPSEMECDARRAHLGNDALACEEER
jgi:hypothetical protein